MKKIVIITFVGFVLCVVNSEFLLAKRISVDKIVARVNGANIKASDLKWPRIDKDGESYSLEDAIEQELLFQKAAERKLLPTGIDIEKRIVAWKEAHNFTWMTDDDFEKRLKDDGLNLKKYRDQLGHILAVMNLKQLEISERIVITSQEVEKYYNNNPEESEDKYLLQTVIVPFDKFEKAESIEKIKDLEWIDLDWVDKSRIAKHMSFVHDMKDGEISKPVKMEYGYQFVKLVKKEQSHLKTIEERWIDIERKLQKDKMVKFEKKFVKELRKKASIVYL